MFVTEQRIGKNKKIGYPTINTRLNDYSHTEYEQKEQMNNYNGYT